MHVPLGSHIDGASRGGGALCTIVHRRLQVLVVGPGGRNGASWCGGAGSASASYMAAPAGALRLKGSDELCLQGEKLCREPFERGRDLGDGGAIARRGCR